MRTMLIVLGMLGATVGTGIEAAIAQYDALPIAPGGRCPSNYTIQQGMCRPYRAYRDDPEYRRSYGIGTTIAGDMKVAGMTKVVVAAKVSPHNLTAPVRQFVPQGTTTCSVETGAFRNNGKTTLNPPVTVPSVGPSDDIQRYEAPGMAVAPGVLLLIKR